jgi:hypothetical protein
VFHKRLNLMMDAGAVAHQITRDAAPIVEQLIDGLGGNESSDRISAIVSVVAEVVLYFGSTA